jgi:hypothetical protein
MCISYGIFMKSHDLQNLSFTKTMIIILVDILLHRHKGQHSEAKSSQVSSQNQ